MAVVAAERYWDVDVVLSDGAPVRIRAIVPEDEEKLKAFHAGLSLDSVYHRFFSGHSELSAAEARRFSHVDYCDRMALVAVDAADNLVAVGRYDRSAGSDGAEVAFTVTDAYQGRGLGTVLLEHLAAYARGVGIRRFAAETLVDNRKMREVFRRAGFVEHENFDGSGIHVEMDIEPSEESVAAMEERDRVAVVQSMLRLLKPDSIAVIGAGRSEDSIGRAIFANLLDGGFGGPVYPVNPRADHVAGVAAFPAVGEIPGQVDLAVIALPAGRVLAAVTECGKKGVHGLVIVSAGFAESGDRGAALERDVVRRAHSYGMRIIGPNCMGVINMAEGISMNATFSPARPRPGNAGFVSQSGGLGIAIIDETTRRGLGISTFVSMGNKSDVSGNDMLRYWEDDPDTKVALLYLESLGNPMAFRRVAQRFSRTKPIVALKAGRSRAGTRSASSHTAALAGPDHAVDALFHATGVIRVDRLEELFDTASLLASQPLPRGPRVAVIGNSGGPGTLAADVPQIAELDLNPVVISERGCCAVDAKIRLVAWTARADETVRRLR